MILSGQNSTCIQHFLCPILRDERSNSQRLASTMGERNRPSHLLITLLWVSAQTHVHFCRTIKLCRAELREEGDCFLEWILGFLDHGRLFLILFCHRKWVKLNAFDGNTEAFCRTGNNTYSGIKIVCIQILHFNLRNFFKLFSINLSHLLLIRLTAPLFQLDHFLYERSGRRSLHLKGERAILEYRNNDRQKFSFTILRLIVELLHKTSNIHACLPKCRTEWWCGRSGTAHCLVFDPLVDFLHFCHMRSCKRLRFTLEEVNKLL